MSATGFLDLPLEIRLMIYSLLTTTCHTCGGKSYFCELIDHPLVFTCSTIHREIRAFHEIQTHFHRSLCYHIFPPGVGVVEELREECGPMWFLWPEVIEYSVPQSNDDVVSSVKTSHTLPEEVSEKLRKG